jgi:flagellar capping protein FliD
METAAERVEKRLGKFLKTDGTSVFDEEDETKLKENVADNIESFVNDYNYLMKRLAQSGDIVDSNYAKKLKNYANAENKELREIGITIKGDGTLELDENKLKAADISQVKKLFTGEDGFAKKVSNLSGQIGKYAKEKVTELEKSSAQASSNYNRYARYANNSQSYNSSYYNNSYYNSKA